jgi:hypothetical protein
MSAVEQLKSFQTGSVRITTSTITTLPSTTNIAGSNQSLQKTIQSVSQLSSKSNEISSFLNNASIASGNGPFNLSKFAREFVIKQNQANDIDGQTSKVTDSKPITRKTNQIIQKVVKSITDNYLKSEKLILILERQVNNILKQSNVTYITVENGQIQAQPIQSQQLNQVIENIQKTITTYTNAVDKYGRRIYNTDSIRTTNDLKNNLSLNQIINFIETIISIALIIVNLKIKIRKALDLSAAANAAAQIPVPNVALAAKLTQQAVQNTAAEQKQLDDLAATQELILSVKRKIDFYGKKYERSKSKLLGIQTTLNSFQTQLFNKTLSGVNNQLTGSVDQLTINIDTRINKTTGFF